MAQAQAMPSDQSTQAENPKPNPCAISLGDYREGALNRSSFLTGSLHFLYINSR
jgi:hypothetical protein